MIASVVPDVLSSAELYDDPPGLVALPEEEPLIAKSVAKRRNEFITVRHCARQALSVLGVAEGPILKGDKGQPLWPNGVVGSMTHTEGFRGAVVGRAGEVRSVGIDAEPHDVLPNGVLKSITLPVERDELAALPEGTHWDRLLFCAKETTYKAWFPLTTRWLGFEDAHITLDPGGTFTSRILIDGKANDGSVLSSFDGRWIIDKGLILTAIVVP
ncbi:4'-phosphopantetheinyl transferase family protein [Mycobacteroides franklinii]|uniref:4'-phosphopantetheinyl transferase superfamily protein n=1 Tax=Mycobacteroides franklinii TaxID=948102 RepID=A0A4R5PI32_9MYCO|nr:4'-phosphopantetheinyl transferase [Mycobacteroides franklinii]ORA62695.1 4'-phosphopantetheinyl transferase [Mycobacteroides franklinii]TDH25993.1 4'-phosphopantetheinyl transferase superfamily protein [Mycobacteroides franklinii]